MSKRTPHASIDTGQPDRDAHLRSNDLFADGRLPGDHLQVDRNRLRRRGPLPVHPRPDDPRGVTKPVTFEAERTGPVTDPSGNTRLGFTGSLKVNRKDWGVNWNMALEAGGITVSDDVTLEFDISATKNA